MMKRNILAVVIPALLVAGAANAAEVYNKDGNKVPRFYVSTSKSIIKALINMHSFEIQLSPIG
ncbi:hypothetical protein [Citrobacter youngae]|uniref:hypothetical protein n=1 Tax=Citrobacter youngae TaxID=133448 RepID=UPI0039B6DC1D